MQKNLSERRKYIRLNSVFPVELYIPDTRHEGRPRLVQGFTRDVSLGGICLTVNDPDTALLSKLKDGDTLFDIHINMPVTHKPVEASARVAWHEVVKGHRHNALHLGLSYERITPRDKQRIMNAARRIKWLPKIAILFIICLACLLGYSQYTTAILVEKNRALIRDFHNAREISEAYKRSSARVSGKYAALEKELAGKEGEEKKALEEELKNILARKKKADVLLEEARAKRLELGEATLENMYGWLRSHQNRLTGLVISFEGDPAIKNWAFTYDQALAAQAFLISGDNYRAEKILAFYKNRAKRKNGAFFNAYNALTGNPAESVVNTGPNIWVGIACLQYTKQTGDGRFLGMAEEIARWAVSLKDTDGGIIGGPGIGWYSTEHNLDAYALFGMLYDVTGKEIYEKEKEKTLKWIRENTYSVEAKRMKRGKGDSTVATDTLAWAIAAVGPARLMKEGMDPDGIMKFAEDHCLVTTHFRRPDGSRVELVGFDFGKTQNIARGGVVSSEWTAQMITAYTTMADFYFELGEDEKAKKFLQKAGVYLGELDKMVISSPSRSGQGAGCLPYASQPSADTGHGWRTPAGSQTGSVAGTAYTIFAKKNYNPLRWEE